MHSTCYVSRSGIGVGTVTRPLPLSIKAVSPILASPFDKLLLPVEVRVGSVLVVSFRAFFAFAVRIVIVVARLLVQILISTLESTIDTIFPVLTSPIIVVLPPRDASADDGRFAVLIMYGGGAFIGVGGLPFRMDLPLLDDRYCIRVHTGSHRYRERSCTD